jgi:hypothetical protein
MSKKTLKRFLKSVFFDGAAFDYALKNEEIRKNTKLK